MKKFFAGAQKGIYAQTVKVDDAQGKIADELVSNALANGTCYALTSADKALKEAVAGNLQKSFMDRVNVLIEAAIELDSMDALEVLREDGKLAKDVFEFIEDTIAARKNELSAPSIKIEKEIMVARGINMSEGQVKSAMAARGLVIGGSCKTKAGEGMVRAFEVAQSGTMAVVEINGSLHKFMVQAIEGNAPVAQNTNQSKESVVVMANQVSEKSKSIVEQAIAGEVSMTELSAEEREVVAELKLQQDLAAFASKSDEKKEKASVVANSTAAQALLAMAGVKPQVKAQAPAAPQVSAAPVVEKAPARSARAAAQNANAGSNAVQNKTQNNGGNVQMVNNTQTQVNAAQAFGGQTVTAQNVRAAGGLELNTSMLPGAQSPALTGWAGVQSQLSLVELDEFVGRNARGNQDFVWYVEESKKYEGQIMTVAELVAAGMKNEALGITDIKFYSPASVAAQYNRQPDDRDFVVVEVFFGQTSYTFNFRRGTFNRDNVQKPYIYSNNIARKQTQSGTRYCEYVSSRRSDKLQVVIQADGKIREARKVWENGVQVVHPEDAPFVLEVGGESWVSAAPNFGIKIGQAPFIQLMMIVDEVSGLKAFREGAQA